MTLGFIQHLSVFVYEVSEGLLDGAILVAPSVIQHIDEVAIGRSEDYTTR